MLDTDPQNRPFLILPASLKSFTSRRKVIATLGLATTAFCASSIQSQAGWFSKKEPSVKVDNFPEEWVRSQGSSLTGYIKYLDSLKLKNIATDTVISAHAKERGNVWNTLPPRRWWKRMGHTLRIVDRISTTMNVPVKEIVSAYRCPKYNARCSGAKRRSWHQANVAVDVKFDTSAHNVTRAARSLRERGLFKGGVGSYSSFTHIDTRGTNVNW